MRHAVIWGRRRQGKSTLALALAIAAARESVIIFDPCEQYLRFPVLDDDQLDEWLETDSHGIVRFSPRDRDVEQAFADLMAVLDGGEWYWGDYTLVLDEASLLQRPQRMHPALDRLIRQAPDDITVIQTMHRPSDAHPLVRSLATDWFWFSTYLARDLDVVRDTWGDDVAEQVRKLPSYHVLHFWLGGGGEPCWKVWIEPEKWYVPIR